MSASNDARLVVGNACALWAEGELTKLLRLFAEDTVFAVHSQPQAPSFVGEGVGRVLLAQRLEMLLDEIKVVSFDPIGLTSDGIFHYSRVQYSYRHYANGIIIAGTMRQKFGFVGNRITQYELFHDTHRMRAFYNLAANGPCSA
jgi:ketosteroid isomerase-like protein